MSDWLRDALTGRAPETAGSTPAFTDTIRAAYDRHRHGQADAIAQARTRAAERYPTLAPGVTGDLPPPAGTTMRSL